MLISHREILYYPCSSAKVSYISPFRELEQVEECWLRSQLLSCDLRYMLLNT